MVNCRTPRFYLNENVPIRLVHLLSVDGIEALHTADVGNRGVSDQAQLEYATELGCILVSHNRKHFRQLHARWLQEKRFHHGILVMDHEAPEDIAQRIRHFVKDMYPTLTPPFCESPFT